MTIHLPDPHPGRCNNYRSFPSDYGLNRMVRCNGSDATPHECWFTPPVSLPQTHANSYMYSPPKPVPWVEPERAVGSGSAAQPEADT